MLILWSYVPGFSQEDLFFHTYLLPGNKGGAGVNSVIQDDHGFYWFNIAGKGLYRFDGDRYENIKIEAESENPDWIQSIEIDNEGRIWLLGYDYLMVFNEKAETFRRIILLDRESRPVHDLNYLYHDSQGRSWTGNEEILVRFEYTEASDSIDVSLISTVSANENDHPVVIHDLQGVENQLFISTPEALLELNEKGEVVKSTPYRHRLQDSRLYLDLKGNVWITTNTRGPILFRTLYEQLIYPWDDIKISGRIDSINFYSNNQVLQDDDSIYWITTGGSGLVRYNLHTTQARIFREDPFRTGAISTDKIDNLYKDRYGNILIISPFTKFSVLKRNLKHVNWYFHDPNDPQTIASSYVSRSYLEDNGDIWIGLEGVGIDHINMDEHEIVHYKPSKADPNSLKNARIMCILKDAQGWVWAGHWDEGLTRFHPETDRFVRYKDSSSLSDTTISHFTVNKLMEDSDGNIWVVTSKAIDVFDCAYHHIRRIPIEDIWAIEEVNDSILMAGVGRFGYLLGDSLVQLAYGASYGVIQKVEDLYYLHDYQQGVQRWKNGTFIFEDSAVFSQLFTAVTDQHGNMWFGERSRKSIVKYNPDSNSFDEIFEIEGAYDLFPSFLRKGKIWGHSSFGLFTFNPDHLSADTVPVHPVLSRLLINNSLWKPDRGRYLKEPIIHTRNVSFDHHVNSFEIGFAAPFLGEENRYVLEYKLQGFEEDWIRADQSYSAMYMNLDPGDYTFMVRAISPLGAESPYVTKLAVQILPAPWASWWAFAIYGLCAIAIGFFIFYYILNQVKLRNRLELQRLELQQVRELDRVKTQFFTNVSHEFRTPLTLILGPLRQIKEGTFKGDYQAIYGIMIRNSERLLNLINQLLDLNKIQSGSEHLFISANDFVEFAKNIYASFEPVASQRQIEYTFQSNVSSVPLFFDTDKIDKVLTNLLSNAFKFTPDHGSIALKITGNVREPKVDQGNGVLKVSVIDSGKGIPTAKLDRVFDHFYQVDQSPIRSYEGSGVGLALVKEYVELHHGAVKVESAPGRGSSFHVLMPLGRDHITDDEIHRSVGYQPKVPFESELTHVGIKTQTNEDGPCLLIIDDNHDMRTYIREVLGDEFAINEAKDGMDGLEAAIEKVPDIIISDVMMPKLDGYQLCSRLKQDERTSHIPVILLTARAGEEAKLEGLEYGADDYITKPFSPAELRVRVQNLMELIRSLREQYQRENLLDQPGKMINSREDRFFNRFMEVLEINLSNTGFGADQFAEEMGMSRSQLHRKLKALTGQPVGVFIKSYRLKYAKKLLEKNYDNISQVAFEVGFNSPSYFTESFKKEFGFLPSEVQKKS